MDFDFGFKPTEKVCTHNAMQSEHFTKFTKMGSSLEHHAVQSVDEASPQPESTESILGAAEFLTSSEVTKTRLQLIV